MVSAVSSSQALVDRPGGPTLRDQIKIRERGILEREKTQLAACGSNAQKRDALQTQFMAARKERGEKYAALLTSADGWQPKPDASPQSQVLTAYYALLGQKARAYAKEHGRPVSLEDVDRVKLSQEDVEGLRKQFGDDAVKKALPLLQRHLCHGRFMTAAAMRFVMSSQFVAYHTALEQERDTVDKSVRQHDDKLDEADHERLRDERKRELVHWDARVVVERTPAHGASAADSAHANAKKVVYISHGGRLVPVGEKPE